MVCSKCGSIVSDGLKFCPTCGNSLNTVVNNQPISNIDNNMYNTNNNMNDNYGGNINAFDNIPTNNNNKNKMILVIAVVAVLAIIAGFIFLKGKGNDKKNSNSNSNSQINQGKTEAMQDCCTKAGGVWKNDLCADSGDGKYSLQNYGACVGDINKSNSNITSNVTSNPTSNPVSNPTSNTTSNVTSNPTSNVTSNTTSNKQNTVKHGGFLFVVPSTYTVNTNTSQLLLMGNDNVHVAAINIVSGDYAKLKKNNNVLLNQMKSTGYKVGSVKVKKYGKVEFIIIPVAQGNQKMVMAYAKLTNSKVILIAMANTSYTLDYSQLPTFANMVASARVAK